MSTDVTHAEPRSAFKPVAVIDIGTTSIRMAIAELDAEGNVHTLESVSQAVNLGRDTFSRSEISRGTIEQCVRALKSYRRLLREYQVNSSDQIRVVATSAVREARNRLAFVDRIYIATGLTVEPIDEAEVARVTYSGIQPYLSSEPALSAAATIVTEVGGGSTELLLVRDGNVIFSSTYRLGSFRLRKTLETFRAPSLKVRNIMESQIQRTVAQIHEHMPKVDRTEMIALGSDVRFAVGQLDPEWDRLSIAYLPVDRLERLTDDILSSTVDEVVRRYHMSFPEAETVGPALLINLQLAREFSLDHLLVTNTNLRDGLLQEMAARHVWSEEFRAQIIRSAVGLGQKFDFDENHARHVAELSQKLFRQLHAEHELGPRSETLLYVAALLHEIGAFVSTRSLHKHSMYLIRNSELFGLGRRELLLVSLVARYHRRASPQPTHEGYQNLDREDRIAVAKMAAMLRVAVALDDSRSQRIQELVCRVEEGRLIISIPHVEDLSLEQLALRQGGSLFEEVFGVQVLLRMLAR